MCSKAWIGDPAVVGENKLWAEEMYSLWSLQTEGEFYLSPIFVIIRRYELLPSEKSCPFLSE